MGLKQKYLCCAVAQNLISALWTGKVSDHASELSLLLCLWLRFLYFWCELIQAAKSHSPTHFCHEQCGFWGLNIQADSMTQTLGVSLLACYLLGIFSFQKKRLVKLYEITIGIKISHGLCSPELERNLRISYLVIQACIPVFRKAEIM